MKRIVLAFVLGLLASAIVLLTSCTASRSTNSGGCKMTQGLVGYR